MNRATFWAPAAAAAFGLLWFLGTMRPPSEPAGEMQLSKAGALPVLDGGRYKPLDTYARVQLMGMNRRQTYYDEKDDRQQAIKWLLNLMSEGYSRLPAVVTIADPDVQAWLNLPPRASGRYFLPEIIQGVQSRGEAVKKLLEKPEGKRTALELAVREVLEEARRSEKAHQEDRKTMARERDKLGAPEKARVFRIDNDQVIALLGLKLREGLRYSLDEFAGQDHARTFQDLEDKARSADGRAEKERDLVDMKVLELYGHLETHRGLVELRGPRLVPGTKDVPEGWMPFGRSLVEADTSANPAGASVERIVRAYALNDARAFNKEVDAYAKLMDARMPGEMRKVRTEAWFNHFAPFYQCSLLYVAVLLLAVASWVVWQEPLRRAAFALAVVVCSVHTLALIIRIYLTGRPPVTNLYSSAVFIGWGGVLICLFVEAARRNRSGNGLALAVAAVLGFVTMIVAHHLGGSGDTMEVMQAVLDTNFWLATHVTTMALGYTAAFAAGFFAMLYIFFMLASAVRSYFADRKALAVREALLFVVAVLGMVAVPAGLAMCLIGGLWLLVADGEPLSLLVLAVLSLPAVTVAGVYAAVLIINRFSAEFRAAPAGELPRAAAPVDLFALKSTTAKSLGGTIYGVICFATLLSFVGTVLGGIWADQSWGRFWGWDPKENGALLIVVMNVLILHARWAGLIRERGMCVLAVLGNMVTAWSWFGTNQLGVGLHAYGFNNTLALGCAVFWVTQLGLAALGLMPLRFWRAYADRQPMAVVMAFAPGRGGNESQRA